MAEKITSSERLAYASSQSASVGKWVLLSGTATYFLTQLLTLIDGFELPSWAVLIAYFVINVLSYAVTKYIEGKKKV